VEFDGETLVAREQCERHRVRHGVHGHHFDFEVADNPMRLPSEPPRERT
jgi:hypothetical protein